LARYDGKLTAAEESTFDAAELLALLDAQSALSPSDRQEAIIRYLSGSEGWRDVSRILGGTFADRDGRPAGGRPGLIDGKEG
jgi:hypothetical protein